ncbi:hypothetical protein PIB30_104240 [Stylosanthes scabra]|uniref:Uncharacterized protein n=1 Tax=Stylosanthes scabra TaxID=79078 RepID=A0ABU6UXY1_9FABA|nr:hypothetical protein [Stylosanthes scabra]
MHHGLQKKLKIRNQEKESLKEEGKEEKGKRRIELKCNSVENLIGKLLTFKKVLHNNDAMRNHLVKDQSKWNYWSYPAVAPLFWHARTPRTSARWPWHAHAVIGNIRPKPPSSMAPPCPSYGAPARLARPRDGLSAPARCAWSHSAEATQ